MRTFIAIEFDKETKNNISNLQNAIKADCKKGNRPSFIGAGSPQMAEALYDYTVEKIRGVLGDCQHGVFGADMKVSLINDGPFTLTLDSDVLF